MLSTILNLAKTKSERKSRWDGLGLVHWSRMCCVTSEVIDLRNTVGIFSMTTKTTTGAILKQNQDAIWFFIGLTSRKTMWKNPTVAAHQPRIQWIALSGHVGMNDLMLWMTRAGKISMSGWIVSQGSGHLKLGRCEEMLIGMSGQVNGPRKWSNQICRNARNENRPLHRTIWWRCTRLLNVYLLGWWLRVWRRCWWRRWNLMLHWQIMRW